MKVLCSILLLLSSIHIYSQSEEEESGFLYEFYGRVYLDKEEGTSVRGEGVQINLYDDNTLVSSYQTDKKAKFVVNAPFLKHYTLEFTKKGYVTKRVIINTRKAPRNLRIVEDFAFDINLIIQKPEVDYSILDFPIALIEFHENYKDFDYNKKYTNNMVRIQNEISAELSPSVMTLIETSKK